MKLESIITADLSQLERAYGQAVSASKTTSRQMDAAFKNSPKIDASAATREYSAAAKKIKASNEIIKESVETFSSEIIESFGVDGDIANVLASELVKLKASTLVAVGGFAALVIGAAAVVGGLIAAAGRAADLGDQIDDLNQQTGLTAETLSGLGAAAELQGKSLDKISGSLEDFSQNLIEARGGNDDLKAAFRALGVDLKSTTDQALRQAVTKLDEYRDGAAKTALANKVFGGSSAELLRVLNSTEGGIDAAIRKAKELGLYFDGEGVSSAKRYKDELNELNARLDGLGVTIGQAVVPAFSGYVREINNAIGKTREFFNSLSPGTQKALSTTLKGLAISALPFGGPLLLAGAADEELLPKRSDRGKPFLENQKKNAPIIPSGSGAKAAISEYEQLKKQLEGLNRDLSVFQDLTSREFDLRVKIDSAQALKGQLEEILKLRREMGQPINVPFPRTSDAAKREIEQLNALKKVRELTITSAKDAAAEAAKAQASEMERIVESFSDVRRELLTGGDEIAAAGAEVGARFAEAMADAIRLGRGDIVAAINELTERAKREARTKQDTERARTATSVAESNLELQRIRIQNELNRGIISEVEARRRQIEASREARTTILAALLAERSLATARGDAAEATRLSVEIEKANAIGEEAANERMQEFQDRLAADFDELFNSLIQGEQSFSDALKSFAKNIATDILSEIQRAMIEELTGEESIGAFLGKAIAGFLGGLFGFGGERAGGGDVRGGTSYIVGEEGPELFTPRSSGYVMDARSTAQMSTGQQMIINAPITFQITSPDGRVSKDTQAQIASRTAGALGRASRRNS